MKTDLIWIIVGLAACALPLGIGVHLVLALRREGRRIAKLMQADFPSRFAQATAKH